MWLHCNVCTCVCMRACVRAIRLTTASHQNSATSPTRMDVSSVSHTSNLNILPTKISAGLPASRLSSTTVRSKLSSRVWKLKTSLRCKAKKKQQQKSRLWSQWLSHFHPEIDEMVLSYNAADQRNETCDANQLIKLMGRHEASSFAIHASKIIYPLWNASH